METLTFSDILRSKMKEDSPPPVEQTISQDPIPESVLRFSFEISQLKVTPPSRAPVFKVYPSLKSPLKTVKKEFKSTPKTPMESRVKKSGLDEISLGKWARFEKMVGISLGEEASRSQILSAFRVFLKRVHPDSAQKSEGHKMNVDFSTSVKVKEELLKALKF